jgi:hypothetical protein
LISLGRAGNKRSLRIVIRVLRVRDGVDLQLLDHGSVVVDEHCMRGIVDETSEFACHGIAGKQNAGFQRLYVKPGLAHILVGLAGPIYPKQSTGLASQSTPEAKVIRRDHLISPAAPILAVGGLFICE